MTRVYVGPEPSKEIEQAVRHGGGELVAAEDAEAIVWLGDVDGLREVLTSDVRWVQLPGAGVERWIDAGVVDRDRQWTAATGVYSHQVAEHALALLLALARRLPQCARATAWGESHGRSLAGATVAIVGAGGIGAALIEMLAPLRVRVLAVTRSGRTVPGAAVSLPADRLAEVWPQADAVVLAAPATTATRHLIGAAELEALPRDALLVNIARGSLVDTDALVRALAEERIGGAGLDVTDPEPLPDRHPLWAEPRAIVTPHSANPPAVLVATLSERVTENLQRFRAGQPLLGLIDPDRGY
jgi:phosphoglycerate dehydrogenase-like enzyme